jgi:hypothetical protein
VHRAAEVLLLSAGSLMWLAVVTLIRRLDLSRSARGAMIGLTTAVW